MPRDLLPIPSSVIDPSTGAPRFGSYRGALGQVDLHAVAGNAWQRIARRKRWFYFAIATDDVFVARAIVRLGDASNTFAYALDRRSMRMIASHAASGPTFACDVGDRSGEGAKARFELGRVRARVDRPAGSGRYAIDARFKDFELDAVLDTALAPPSLTAIAPIVGGVVNTTEKRTLLTSTGELRVAGQRYALDGGLAGYDYTQGLLARRTAWRWAFLLGKAKSGERVGMNLVQGFVGEPECGVWIDGEVHPLAEGRFDFARDRPLEPWRVSTADGGVELSFVPGGMHADNTNLGIVKSRFVQPAGHYTGKIRAGGRELELERVVGVTEDQEVVW
jgi:hypothetical protein